MIHLYVSFHVQLRVLTHPVTRYAHTNQLTVAMEGNSDSITLQGHAARGISGTRQLTAN